MARKQYRRSFIKQWRKHRGLTQDQLAERTGVSKPYISQIERGDRQWSQDLLETFAEVLRTDAASLITRDPTEPEGLWTIWDQLDPPKRRELVELAKVVQRTGTDD